MITVVEDGENFLVFLSHIPKNLLVMVQNTMADLLVYYSGFYVVLIQLRSI